MGTGPDARSPQLLMIDREAGAGAGGARTWTVRQIIDGQFPDGAALVKEVFATSTNEMTTGTVSHADKLKGWFVMVRDSKGTHPGNPLWGDGWGWLSFGLQY